MSGVEAPNDADHASSRKAANDYCKSSGSRYAVEANITTQDIATLITMLLSIASDCDPEIVPMLILFMHLTDKVPLASMTLTIRYSVVDIGAFKMAQAPNQRIQNVFDHPTFNDDWAGLCGMVTNSTAIFSMLTRALHGILGFSGPIYTSIRNLAPWEIIPALRIIYDNHASVTQSSVSYEWSFWYGRTHIPGEDMKKFVDDLKKLANELDCHGHALTIIRKGPDTRSILQRLVDMIRAADAATFGIVISIADGYLEGAAVSTVQLKDVMARLVVTSRSVYGSSMVDAASVVGAIIDRAKSCFRCGGYGHVERDCPTPGRRPIKDDGTSKPDPNEDRAWTPRDDSAGSQPRGTRGTRRKKITDVTRTSTEFKWTKDLGPCRHCGKEGHLNRDCDDPEAKAKEAGRKAARAAKVAAGATPAYLYQLDVEHQLAADAEIADADPEVHPAPPSPSLSAPPSPLRVVPADATPVPAPAASGSAAPAALPVTVDPAVAIALHLIVVAFAVLLGYLVYVEVGASADDSEWGDDGV